MKSHRFARVGATLLELLVALVILGIAAGVVTVAVRPTPAANVDGVSERIATARRTAIETGEPVRITIDLEQPTDVTANPDGSVVADTALRIDRLSGGLGNATR